jgi:hypothetical protein
MHLPNHCLDHIHRCKRQRVCLHGISQNLVGAAHRVGVFWEDRYQNHNIDGRFRDQKEVLPTRYLEILF